MQSRVKSKAALLWLAAVASCGQPPVPVDPHTGVPLAPAGATARPDPSAVLVRGTLHLRGDFAGAQQGTVFVTVREASGGPPALIRSYVVGGDDFDALPDGELVLRFQLMGRDVMPGLDVPMPREPVLKVSFSRTGTVDGLKPRDSVLRPVALDGAELELVLPSDG